jgi:hypothetical protein
LRPWSKRTDADTRLADQASVSFCDERCPPGKIAWTTLQAKIKEHAQEVQAALNSLK